MLTGKTGKKYENEYISRRHLKALFTRTESYHKWMLKTMFRNHYRPDDSDDAWTRNLTTKQMNDIRLHLSWEIGMNTFGWSREKVAESIVSRYKKLGVFLFLKHVVVTDLTR